MQSHFDSLYAQSTNGQNFYGLLDLMKFDENIRLAYRNIKRNTGSKTAGYDGLTIECLHQKFYQRYNECLNIIFPKPFGVFLSRRQMGKHAIRDSDYLG